MRRAGVVLAAMCFTGMAHAENFTITDEYGGRYLKSQSGHMEILTPNYATGGGWDSEGNSYEPNAADGLTIMRNDGGTSFAAPNYATVGFSTLDNLFEE